MTLPQFIVPTEALNPLFNRGRLYEGWIAIFSTFVKLTVDWYNLRLRFGIYKLYL